MITKFIANVELKNYSERIQVSFYISGFEEKKEIEEIFNDPNKLNQLLKAIDLMYEYKATIVSLYKTTDEEAFMFNEFLIIGMIMKIRDQVLFVNTHETKTSFMVKKAHIFVLYEESSDMKIINNKDVQDLSFKISMDMCYPFTGSNVSIININDIENITDDIKKYDYTDIGIVLLNPTIDELEKMNHLFEKFNSNFYALTKEKQLCKISDEEGDLLITKKFKRFHIL